MKLATLVRLLMAAFLALALSMTLSAQGKVVFTQGPNATELWIVRSDGANLRRILTMPSYIVTPRWSGDGKRIAFQSATTLWIVNEDGSNLHAIPGANVADAGLTWDSTGSRLIYATVCICCEHLRCVNPDGSDNRLFFNQGGGVMQIPDARPHDAEPSSLVAYFRFQCGGEFSTQFFGLEKTREGGVDFMVIPGSTGIDRQEYPRWSRDGSKLATIVRIAGSQDRAIEIFDPLDPGAPRTRLLQTSGTYSSVDFGCSSSQLFLGRGEGGAALNVWRYNIPTQSFKKITNFNSGELRDLDFYCTPIEEPPTP